MRFRKKPVVIEAVLVADALRWISSERSSLVAAPQWFRDAYESGYIVFCFDHVSIFTLEGTLRAEKTDWIIRGIQGELYPINNQIFRETYDPVD
jgi:hypothetical protein